MKAFTQLFHALDATTRTSEKVAALEHYFRSVPPEDAAWTLQFLSGRRLKRLIKTSLLREWTAEVSGFPPWLIDECYETVGDLGETLALILPEKINPSPPPSSSSKKITDLGNMAAPDFKIEPLRNPSLHMLVESRLLPLGKLEDPRQQRALLLTTWSELDRRERLVWNKLITGAFRVGVSRTLLVRALANIAGLNPPVVEHRLMGDWQPTVQDFQRLTAADDNAREPARPYPFFLASPLEGPASALGEARDWQFEWKWDGIRAQLIHRSSQCVIWSRGEEIITAAFPEIAEVACRLPEGTVLDGELLAWENDAPLPFDKLQRRLNRKEASAKLQSAVPVIFMAYDLLERDGADWRENPLQERREELSKVVSAVNEQMVAQTASIPAARFEQGEFAFATAPAPTLRRKSETSKTSSTALRLSPALRAADWDTLSTMQAQARNTNTEGIMLKKLDSVYGTGRQRGAWWKWKVAPFVCDAVLIAAQPGHGRRATLFTDYTFAVWRGQELVPVAKAYSGLTNEEINTLDAWVRGHTTGRYGPVRSVTPELVFELAFEGINESTRHKSGIALRFPRISRQRTDKKAADADTVETLRTLLEAVNKGL